MPGKKPWVKGVDDREERRLITEKYNYYTKRDAQKEDAVPEPEARDTGTKTIEPKKMNGHDHARPDVDPPGMGVAKDDFRWTPPHHDIFNTFAVPVLDPRHVTESYRAMVFENATASGFDAGALYESMLTSFSSIVNFAVKIKMRPHDDEFVESARLWTMIVGETGTKKSPVMRASAKALMEIDKKLGEDFNAEMSDYLAMTKEERAEVDTPKRETVLVDSDFSPEGLVTVGIENKRGYMILSDEIRSFLTSPSRFNSKGGAGSGASNFGYAMLLKLYNGDYAKVIRADATKEKSGYPNASVLGSIQPKKLFSLAAQADDEDGLVQRFSFVFIDRETMPKETEAEITHKLSIHNGLLKRAQRKLANMSTHFAFSPNGHAWREKMKGWIELQREAYGTMLPTLTAALRKWESQFARRCLVSHLIENIDKDQIPGMISGDTCQQVFNYMTEYQFEHTKAFYNLLLGNDEHDLLRNIVEHALIHDKRIMTVADLVEGSRQFAKIDRSSVKRFMEKLEAMGYCRQLARGKGDRFDTVKMAMNPFVFSQHTELQAKLKRRNAIWHELWLAKQAENKASAKGEKPSGRLH
jgi:hypothetical protein